MRAVGQGISGNANSGLCAAHEKQPSDTTGNRSFGWNSVLVLAAVLICAFASWMGPARADCTIPNELTNGQVADAAAVMEDFDAVAGCAEDPGPRPTSQLSGAGGGVVTLQNPSATADYNFNVPATAGNAGDLLTSGGGGSNPETWTPTGSSGHVLPFLDGDNSWSGTQTFGPVVGSVSTQSGTTYTVAASDCGTTLLFTNASAITLTTLNSLPAGCAIAIEQGGDGQITVAAGTGTTQHSAHSYTKTYGQYAILGLFVDTNVGGSAADIIITGDGA